MPDKLFALENVRISLPVQGRFRGAKTNAAMNYIVVELNRTNLSGAVLTLYDSRVNIIFDMPDIENFKSEYVKLYPNPAKYYIIVELLTGNIDGANIEVYDNQGKYLFAKELPGKTQHCIIPVKNLKTGIYYIKVKMDNKTLNSKKFSVVK